MDFINLTIDNFISIEHAEVPLYEEGVVLLEGQVLGTEGTQSNGAGKSSILEAICWCLYDRTIRGIRHDEVIAEFAGGNCSVEAIFTHDNASFKIKRFRKCSGYADSWLTIYRDGIDMTGATFTATQKLLEGILPISFDMFVRTVLLCPDLQFKFTGSSNEQMKEQIESIVGVSVYNQSIDRINIQKKQLDTEIYALDMSLKMQENTLASTNQEYTLACEEVTNYSGYSSIAGYNPEVMESRLLTFQQEIDIIVGKEKENSAQINSIISEERGFAVAISKLEQELSSNKTTLNRLKTEREACNKSIESLKSSVCPTCVRQWESATAKLPEFETKLEQVSASMITLLEGSGQLTNTITASKEKQAKIQEEIKAYNASTFEQKQTLQILLDKKDKLGKMLTEAKTKAQAATARKERSEKALATARESVGITAAKLFEKKSELDYVISLKDIFQSMRSNVLSSSISDLNDIIARFLDVLFPDLDVIIRPVTEKATGVVSKISIDISSRSYKSWSEGEKRRVDLVIQLGLVWLYRKYSTFGCNILLLDEVMDKLDPEGASRFIQLLQQIVATDVGTILVVTHLPHLKGMLDKSWLIQKENGRSSINFQERV